MYKNEIKKPEIERKGVTVGDRGRRTRGINEADAVFMNEILFKHSANFK